MFSYFKGASFQFIDLEFNWLQKKLQDSINLLKQFENGTLPHGITDHKVWIFTVNLQLPTLGISRPFFDKKSRLTTSTANIKSWH